MTGGTWDLDGKQLRLLEETSVAKEECTLRDSNDEGWVPAPAPAVFKDVRLCYRLRSENSASEVLPTSEGAYRPKYGPCHRSYCVVSLKRVDGDKGCAEAVETARCPGAREIQLIQFRLGESYGHLCLAPVPASHRPWSPPRESKRVDMAPWVTEAVLCLDAVGASADFKTATSMLPRCDVDGSDVATGPLVRHHLELLEASPTYDLLADDGVVLRILDPVPGGQKPRDLAHVTASWRIWFLRNSQLVVSTSSGEGVAEDGGGEELVIDTGQLMVALELGLKEMECGSRACLRISEEWGHGPLMPSGGPMLQGAAVWAELTLLSVENEPAPGEHASVDAALRFALEKKKTG